MALTIDLMLEYRKYTTPGETYLFMIFRLEKLGPWNSDNKKKAQNNE